MKRRVIFTGIAVLSALLILAGCGSRGEFTFGSAINVTSREDGSGTRGAFTELLKIERKTDTARKDLTYKEAVIVNKTDVMISNVSGDLYGIGYISAGSLDDRVSAVAIDGALPTAENIKNGAYKVARPFIVVHKGALSEAGQNFLEFILSIEGQSIASESYISAVDAPEAYMKGGISGKVTVAGSSSVTPLMEKLAEAYMALNPDVNIEIQMTDSSSGINSCIDATCDIGMSSRDLKEAELGELTPVVIARDGVAVIVNNENPIKSMTGEQIKDIFTGEKVRWDF
jgi:phosphate transport system substrate-binding protein